MVPKLRSCSLEVTCNSLEPLENPKSSTTLCWPRPVSITTTATTSSSEQPAVNTSVSAPSPSPMLVTLTSSVHYQRPRPEETKMLIMNWTRWNKKVLILNNKKNEMLLLLGKLNSITGWIVASCSRSRTTQAVLGASYYVRDISDIVLLIRQVLSRLHDAFSCPRLPMGICQGRWTWLLWGEWHKRACYLPFS